MIRIKKVVLACTVLGMILVLAGVGTVAAQSAPDCSTVSYSGTGTEVNPYEVGDVNQLQCIEERGLDANYLVVSDIDASETSSWNGGDGFDPIGEPGRDFEGTFDGQGHEITDLTIDRPDTYNVALFSKVGDVDNDGTVTDVSVVNASMNGYDSVSGLVGFHSGGTISESYVTGSIKGSNNDVGGLVGDAQGDVIRESYAAASVEGNRDVGGLVGSSSGTIEESYATGSVEGDESVGGLVGTTAVSGLVTESYATGSVEGNRDVGGLAGNNFRSMINKSYATGAVEGAENVGGFVGRNDGMVSDSYAIGSVNGSSVVGGFAGVHEETGGMITESYAAGLVNGSDRVGGLVGVSEEGAPVSDSYWDIETTGQSTSAGGTGLITSEMTGTAAMTNMGGFDFTDTWRTAPDAYPKLSWRQPTASFTFSPSNPAVGESVTFDGSTSSSPNGVIQRYEWDYGDGNTASATGATASHSYSGTGFYAVELTVIDEDGVTDSTTKIVEVRDPSTSPIDGVSDDLWTAVTQDDGSEGLSLADLGNAIQQYQNNPDDADVGGVSISLSDLGSLIQYYRTEVV